MYLFLPLVRADCRSRSRQLINIQHQAQIPCPGRHTRCGYEYVLITAYKPHAVSPAADSKTYIRIAACAACEKRRRTPNLRVFKFDAKCFSLLSFANATQTAGDAGVLYMIRSLLCMLFGWFVPMICMGNVSAHCRVLRTEAHSLQTLGVVRWMANELNRLTRITLRSCRAKTQTWVLWTLIQSHIG